MSDLPHAVHERFPATKLHARHVLVMHAGAVVAASMGLVPFDKVGPPFHLGLAAEHV